MRTKIKQETREFSWKYFALLFSVFFFKFLILFILFILPDDITSPTAKEKKKRNPGENESGL